MFFKALGRLLVRPFFGRATATLIDLAVIVVAFAAPTQGVVAAPNYREDRILVQPKGGRELARLHGSFRAEVLQTFAGFGGLQVIAVPAGETVWGLIAHYEKSGLVEFAEPDYLVHAALAPNDPKYLDGTLWGLNNIGQSGGTPDADIDAPEGWEVLRSAAGVVVAVLDTGVRYTHEDLAANMWVNPGDGSHGLNALTGTSNPSDDNGHGTLISGILGGVGNNGKGVAGVAWQVQIMACKCLDSAGNGSDSAIIACMDYARTNGARIINASFDSTNFSLGLSNALRTAREAGMIVVASCGNNALDVDVSPRYPACYDLDNIVSVAYTTRTDTLGRFSNYGAKNVDLAAPGAAIYSTFFTADNSYLGASALEGDSFSAGYVSGTFALMLTKYPAENYQQIIHRVFAATDPLPALAGKCVTGGRLNLRKALSPPVSVSVLSAAAGAFQLRVHGGPNRTCTLEAASALPGWTPIYTNTTSFDGTFEFTDTLPGSPTQRFYRAVSTP